MNIPRARTGPKPRPVAERFWRLVDRLGPDECWIWRGGKNAFGHGTVWDGSQTAPDERWIWRGGKNAFGHGTVWDGSQTAAAHRVAWELLVSPIPPSLHLDHFRMNPGPRTAPCSRACVNPSHAEPATNAENVLRGGGITATHARKTRCPGGHVYDKKRRGGRACRRCLALASRKHYALKHRKETR